MVIAAVVCKNEKLCKAFRHFRIIYNSLYAVGDVDKLISSLGLDINVLSLAH